MIAIGSLDFASAAWFMGIFVGLVPVYSPPVAMLLGICGIVGSTIALRRRFAGPSMWLRTILIAGMVAAVLGLAGAVWLGFVFPYVH